MKPEPIEYLKLTDDISFKRYFSSNKQLLFSLIKTFLPISDDASDVSIVNPNMLDTASDTANQNNPSDDRLYLQDSSIPPATLGGKQVMLDFNVKLSSGENVGIEMQAYVEKHFMTRMFTYWAQLFLQPIERGQKYDQVKPSYLLAFILFNRFDGPNHINKIIATLEGYQDRKVSEDFNMVIVELKKFNKHPDQLVDMSDRWCYIMKRSAELTAEQVKHLSQDGETKMALEHLVEVSKEEKEYWRAIHKGRREWERQLKREEEIEKSRVQGIQEKQREIALSMLQKGLEVSLISEVTDLSVAEIEQLNYRTAD